MFQHLSGKDLGIAKTFYSPFPQSGTVKFGTVNPDPACFSTAIITLT